MALAKLFKNGRSQAVRPIGERDLLIAATAKSLVLIVVTHNVREFSRVPDLKVEDWHDEIE
jgi:tRNA(fMet)-specific endonuclease VapC